MHLTSQLFLFLVFPLFVFLFFLFGRKYKKTYLIIISLFFLLSFSINNAIVLLILALFNYFISKKVYKEKIILFFGIVINVLTLVFFKYLSFITINFNSVFKASIPLLEIALPIGISYVIFQNITYLVDLYRDNEKSKFIDFLLYTFYFPRLVNGPILKYDNFVSELNNNKKITIDDSFYGVKRICFGLGKVCILSYVLGNIWSNIYYNVNFTSSFIIPWIGIVVYSLYLFLNFSGFIDISIGISSFFGIKLQENFDYPYLSKSISEFWRKWHISLSNWLKEYVYIPLGGNRKGNVYFNIMIVFLVSGIWHGASWNFIFWGIYIGLINIIDKRIIKTKLYAKLPNIIKISYTYFLILIGWVLFASNGILLALNYFKYMFGLGNTSITQFEVSYFITKYNVFFIIMSIIVSFVDFRKLKTLLNEKQVQIIEGVLALIILIISIMFIVNNSYTPSIYANF